MEGVMENIDVEKKDGKTVSSVLDMLFQMGFYLGAFVYFIFWVVLIIADSLDISLPYTDDIAFYGEYFWYGLPILSFGLATLFIIFGMLDIIFACSFGKSLLFTCDVTVSSEDGQSAKALGLRNAISAYKDKAKTDISSKDLIASILKAKI